MFRAIDKWLFGYVESVMRRPGKADGPVHLMFCVADHFEPFHDNPGKDAALAKIRRWRSEYPAAAAGHKDADGRHPQHTFFYPQEEYDGDCIGELSGLCANGFGEVEIHLHHRNDTAEGLREKLSGFRDVLREKHGLLGSDCDGNVRYGFIHGNWALCNSRPDGDWCGVNEELGVLNQTGCYADFTFPSAPSPTQPRTVNAIYRAEDTPGRPRGCDSGERVRVWPRTTGSDYGKRPWEADSGNATKGHAKERDESGRRFGNLSSIAPGQSRTGLATEDRNSAFGNELMLITGPLALDWRRRKWGVLPRLENGAITSVNPPTPERIDLWVRQYIHVQGRPEWMFVKVHTHGCRNEDVFLGESMNRAHDYLGSVYNDGKSWVLHYVTAREMYNIARAAEDGKTGNPGQYRDYEVLRPPILVTA